jgi:hypothetical protein
MFFLKTFRPDEVHLCAPAIMESELEHSFGEIENNGFIYHAEGDWVLQMFKYIFGWVITKSFLRAFQRFESEVIGIGGLPQDKKVENVTVVNASEHLGPFVHFGYKRNFHKFAVNNTTNKS